MNAISSQGSKEKNSSQGTSDAVKGRAPKRRKLKSRPREGWARPFVRNTGEIHVLLRHYSPERKTEWILFK